MPEQTPPLIAQSAGSTAAAPGPLRVVRPSPGGIACETPRLRLRELTPDDLPFVARMLGDPAVMRYYPRMLTMDESRTWLTRQRTRYERDGHGLWLVEDRASGAPRGQVGLAIQVVDDTPEPEVGWLIHHPFWRQGLASEAAAAVRDLAFAWGHDHVISLIRPENAPSQGVARRIGMHVDRETVFHGYRHLVYRTRPNVPAISAGGR